MTTRGGRKRAGVEVQLAELERVAAAPTSPEKNVWLHAALREAPSMVAAGVARVVREQSLADFAGDLVFAFRRFVVDGVKADPGCRAKLAALEALDFGGHDEVDVFLEATRYVQLEPAWGPPVDSADGVRSRGVLALARVWYPQLSVVAGSLLADPASPVRQSAAEALASTGEPVHAGALALRWSVGDEDPLVLLACMTGLLVLAPDYALPRLRKALFGADDGGREMAALALGQSTRSEALDLLLEHLEAAPVARERAATLRALGLQRNDRAIAALLNVVTTGSVADAEAALAGLRTRRFDPGVRDRAAAAVRAHPEAGRLQVALTRAVREQGEP